MIVNVSMVKFTYPKNIFIRSIERFKPFETFAKRKTSRCLKDNFDANVFFQIRLGSNLEVCLEKRLKIIGSS